MAKKIYKREELEGIDRDSLRRFAFQKLGLIGYSKSTKPEVIDAIIARQYKAPETPKAKVTGVTPTMKPMTGIEFAAQSTITKPDEKFGFKTTTTVHVSCGASSAQFDVAGRTVKEVADFLREALNVDRMSTGLVNGKEVSGDYIVKPGDHLEFLKPAGQKGC